MFCTKHVDRINNLVNCAYALTNKTTPLILKYF